MGQCINIQQKRQIMRVFNSILTKLEAKMPNIQVNLTISLLFFQSRNILTLLNASRP